MRLDAKGKLPGNSKNFTENNTYAIIDYHGMITRLLRTGDKEAGKGVLYNLIMRSGCKEIPYGPRFS